MSRPQKDVFDAAFMCKEISWIHRWSTLRILPASVSRPTSLPKLLLQHRPWRPVTAEAQVIHVPRLEIRGQSIRHGVV